MKRASRTAARAVGSVVALLSALALVVVAGVATSASAHPGRPHHAHHGGLEHDGSGHVLLALGRLDQHLAGALRHRLEALAPTDRAALLTHQASDLDSVETVATAYSQAPTGRHLHSAQSLLHSYRPQRYVRAAAMLSRGGRAAASIVALGTQVGTGTTEAADLATAARLLAEARAHRFSARTQPADMRAARREIARARGLVHEVRAALVPVG
jgi:hypothetical protein